MADLLEAKKKAINFLWGAIAERVPYLEAFLPNAESPLIFEGCSYLANKNIIKKTEYGDSIKQIWDLWTKNDLIGPRHVFWPATDRHWWETGSDPDRVNYDYEVGFDLENHVSMFRAKEVFAIPGYQDDFTLAKRELITKLKDQFLLDDSEHERILWQIARSPFLREALKEHLRNVAEKMTNTQWGWVGDSERPIPPTYNPTRIFFLLTTNFEDYCFDIAEGYIGELLGRQRKNGSFHDDLIQTCLILCSVRLLGGIDKIGTFSSRAINWLLSKQQENGFWRYRDTKDVIGTTEFKEEDIFITVFVLETLDLITNDKPLPIWAPESIERPMKIAEKRIPPLSIPEGSKWGDISISFTGDLEESISIMAAGKPIGVWNFIELGFDDRRTHGKTQQKPRPNDQWELLVKFAKRQGVISSSQEIGKISWDGKWRDSEVLPDKAAEYLPTLPKDKPHIKALRRKLKSIFRIADDPFYSYKKRPSGYKTKFSIGFLRDKSDEESL